jgi:hypothetical protein
MNHGVLVLGSAFSRELHLILISVAATRFDGDSQGRTRMFFLRRYSTELLHKTNASISGRTKRCRNNCSAPPRRVP